MWTRDDLKKVAKVWFSETGTSVYCITDHKQMGEMNAASGQRMSILTSIAEVVLDGEQKARVAMRPSNKYVLSAEQDVHLAGPTQSMLCGVFGKWSVCISEMTGAVYNYDKVTGRELWQYTPTFELHVTRLWYRNEDACFYAVEFEYDGKSRKTLLKVVERTGETKIVCGLATLIADVCPSLAAIIVSTGEVISLLTVKVVEQIPVAGVSIS